ncbi:MAG: hypothetical protein OEZ39_16665 [Gammaproteobacteria bacterium]|nr:hypothetical protein [Gammaproteobacteria bacterium]MDH5653493.1 hypothetical protein [Gammaproteobacteria bacterium]
MKTFIALLLLFFTASAGAAEVPVVGIFYTLTQTTHPLSGKKASAVFIGKLVDETIQNNSTTPGA